MAILRLCTSFHFFLRHEFWLLWKQVYQKHCLKWWNFTGSGLILLGNSLIYSIICMQKLVSIHLMSLYMILRNLKSIPSVLVLFYCRLTQYFLFIFMYVLIQCFCILLKDLCDVIADYFISIGNIVIWYLFYVLDMYSSYTRLLIIQLYTNMVIKF